MTIRKIAGIVFIIALTTLLVILYPRLSELSASDILAFAPDSGLLTALIIIGLFCIKPAAMFIPIAVLFLSAGIMFTNAIAAIVVLCGLFCELTIGYAAGRRLGLKKLLNRIEQNKRLKKFLANQRDTGPSMCFFASFLPFPVDVLTMFLGAAGIKYHVFMFFTLLGLMPLAVPCVLIGSSILNPMSKEFIIPFAAGICANAIIYFIYKKVKQVKV